MSGHLEKSSSSSGAVARRRTAVPRIVFGSLEQEVLETVRVAYTGLVVSARSCLDATIELGNVLSAAKSRLPHGSFEAWVGRFCPFGPRTAQNLMDMASHSWLLYREFSADSEAPLRFSARGALTVIRAYRRSQKAQNPSSKPTHDNGLGGKAGTEGKPNLATTIQDFSDEELIAELGRRLESKGMKLVIAEKQDAEIPALVGIADEQPSPAHMFDASRFQFPKLLARPDTIDRRE